MRLAIVIITYNIDTRIFLLQIQGIQKYCKNNYTIHVVDNSTDSTLASAIAHQCEIKNISYAKVNAGLGAGTDSHTWAANFSYKKWIKGQYDYVLYIDHDCIPINYFDVQELLKDKIMGGLPQGKYIIYIWAGLVFWNDREIDQSLINFSPSHELQLDTGGMFYKAIEKYGDERIVYFNEEYHNNPHTSCTFYNFYSILGGVFMHFINSSNWNKKENHNERINSLINICQQWMEKN